MLISKQETTRVALRGPAISIVIHGFVIGLLLLVGDLATRPPTKRISTSFSSAPVQIYLPAKPMPTPRLVSSNKPPLAPPLHEKLLLPQPPETPAPKPPESKTAESKAMPAPPVVASAPASTIRPFAVSPPPVASAPPPAVRTDVFASIQKAPEDNKPRESHVGGFGDLNANASSENKSLALSQVGRFDMPNGAQAGHAGSQTGNGQRGVSKETAFASAGAVGGPAGGGAVNGPLKTGAFSSDAADGAGTAPVRPKPLEARTKPVEILVKPKPIYTAEARAMKVEGDVAIEVLFLASGQVQVLRVIHSLGYGLDEAAQQVVRLIQFRPSTRDGAPVDSKAIIRVTFELT